MKMSDDSLKREKYWQELAGEFASLANWAAVELCSLMEHTADDVHVQANEILDRVTPYLDFDERSSG